MRCYHCNSEVPNGVSFCPYCGSPVTVQQPQQGQYQQPQQGQYQQPQQGQYQQPQQGQYQQPQQGQYQQPQQGQYQQPQQGQYQQPQQGQYQQFSQQKPQLPHRPQLTIMEAINLASNRLTETEGRSRRSEFWWWYLVVCIGGIIVSFIPYLGAFSYLLEYALIYSITLRRLNDVPAPDWFGKAYLSIYGASSILLLIYVLGFTYDVGIAEGIIDLIGYSSFSNLMGVFYIGLFLGGIGMIYWGIKDSNPEIDPIHGPSPKYTL